MTRTAAAPSLLFTLATFASGSIAIAETPAPKAAAAVVPATPALPAPSKELEAFMKGFEGSWTCDTKFAAGSMGPGSPEMRTKSAVKITKEFDGFSWHGEVKVIKTKATPAMSVVFQVGYESGTKQATFVSYDSMGGAMMGVGPISGDSASFIEEGYMMGMKARVRETMTRKGPKEIRHSLEADQGKGFQPLAEDTCKK